jgi:hypothetical protein
VPITPWDGSEAGKVTIIDVLIHAIGKAPDRLVQADHKQVARARSSNIRRPVPPLPYLGR